MRALLVLLFMAVSIQWGFAQYRLISKIVISEPQEKDGTENYRRTPETVTMEIHFNLKPIPELGTIERGSGSHK